jgi:hypothetical protein
MTINRRIALTTLAAGAAALPTIVAASQAPSDPVFDTIEANRVAWSASEAAEQAYHANPSSETGACHEASSNAIDQTRDALRDTRPTTVAGAAALAAYIFTEMQNTAFDQDDRDLLEALADGLKLLSEKQS